MKKIILAIIGVLILTGCTNKELLSYYENTQAGGKIDSYQLDLRISGTYGEESFSEAVKIDNYKGTQFKIDYVSKNLPIITEESETEVEETEENVENEIEDIIPDRLLQDNASYIIDSKKYLKEEGVFKEVNSLSFSNPDVYLETITKGNDFEFLFDEKIGEENYKVFTLKVSKKNMQPILDDGVLKNIELKEDVAVKLWIDKEDRIFRVVYYMKDGDNRLEVNASIFRINTIRDMSNIVR
ncbi:MAG: lipoprotein [Tenericutes bacterium]|nr:lipoprotein [Mycoplasmatota bacterium]